MELCAPIIGLETEYGIGVAGIDPSQAPDPITLSELVVREVAASTGWSATWNYADEHPLTDARGTIVDRRQAHPDLLTDVVRHENVLLGNGSRIYVDHAHPEHSGPEVGSARDAVVWDRAGDQIMQAAVARVANRTGLDLRLTKNTTDGKGHSYGCHENYLLPRSLPFDAVVRGFSAFLASRVVVGGAGRVGVGQLGERAAFQIGQRPDFFERRVGLETTINRPLINTRDEPHADPRTLRRLHVITGDANLSETATWLKVGTARLVLDALIDGAELPELADPVTAFRTFSHDVGLWVTAPLTSGESATALDLQRRYLDACAQSRSQLPDRDDILDAWRQILDDLATDPMRCADRLDWVAKWRLLDGLQRRHGLSWDHPKLAALDLLYADLNPDHGLFFALEARGDIVRLTSDADITAARINPPTDTRAWLRGRILDQFRDAVATANWDSITLDLGRGGLRTIKLNDPASFTKASHGAIVDAARTPQQLLDQLGSS